MGLGKAHNRKQLNEGIPKLTAGLWLLGMIVIGFLGFQALTKDWLETSFLALLPANEQQPEVAKAIQQHNALINKKVIWLTGAPTSQEAIGHAQNLKQQLEQSRLFNKVVLEFSQQQYIKQYQQLFPYRYQLLDAQSREILTKNPDELIKQNLEILNSPIGQMQSADFERDPLLIFSRYFSAQNPIKLNLEQGIVVLSDQHRYWALILTDLQDDRLQLDKLETLLGLVNSAESQIKTAGGELLVTGMPLFTAHGAESAKQEISTVGFGSSIGIIVLLWLTFRSIRPLVLSALAIGAGLFAALVICVLFFGKIHILTLVFGASLIGVADDYAQHFLCDSFGEKDWDPRKSLKFILPGLSFGLLSNLLSYAGLGFSPFPGLQEVALFSAVGLLVAWLTVVLLFPLLLTGFIFDHQPGILKLTTYWEQHWPLWIAKHRRWLSVLMLVFIAGGLWRLSPQDDVHLLQSAPAELLQTADKIRSLLPITHDSQFFLVSGKDQAEWYQHEQQLLDRLQLLKQQKVLTSAEGLSQYWPDENQQHQNYQLLKNKLVDSGLLERYMTELGFDDQSVTVQLQQFKAAETNTLTLPEWLANADESKQSLWLGCAAGHCQSTVVLTGITDLAVLPTLQDLPGVVWVDQVESVSSLFARYRIRASGLLAAAFSLALVGLGFKFGWRNALTVMTVPVVSLAVSLAMLGWFNQLFSLFNLFALLLVLGIGVDYGLFFFMAGDRRASTSLGVTLSALTTLLAFGLLAISSTEIVHAFGFTLTAGIVTALLCAPLVGFRGQINDKHG
ncbi:MAG: MMPL family transporter [Methylococcaceae bacterium]|nr:MMPL family transporter [Methylococcaceae bacterium]MDP2394928.1 MMPL family transporter [Methylococcaceae bacterium]MDP3019454.1 MMPL family transporter [Methylococcaceae bacterium]MDP3391753.1 MMPL family transporter [Methylococcaceae bacterium]MDP3932039.1 MMPL family transporter [Methylococcaceae bacterium]